jgi:hypothetical protein
MTRREYKWGMNMCRFMYVFAAALVGSAMGCGDSGETEADRAGVGAQCTDSQECESTDEDFELVCLQFKGGYCGLENCTGDAGCPDGSACIMHEDGTNYCFRECTEKLDCNRNRPTCPANCVSSVTFVDPRNERKACKPPSADEC